MDIKEEDILGPAIATHWYYVTKGEMVRRHLKGLARLDWPVPGLLDVGAGSGVFSRQMLEAGLAQRAVCIDPEYAEESDELHGGRPLAFRRTPDAAAPLVLMMDVLEHVDDDTGLVRAYFDGAPSGTVLLVTVPAFEFLWSGHDVFLEHRRRYTRAGLTAALTEAGLEVVSCRYFFGLLFPVAAAIRLIDRLKQAARATEPKSAMRPAPGWLNAVLTAVHRLEMRTLFPVNRIAGLTVTAVAVKP